MKKAVFICALIGEVVLGFAQHVPLYSLNFDNRYVHNPARTGFNGNPELYLMYRKQWVDFPSAPETRAISFDVGFKKGGVGVYVFNDVLSGINTWGGNISYAYHITTKNNVHKISIGLAAGIQQYRFDWSKHFIKDPDDPELQGDKGLVFDGSAGLHYFAAKGPYLNLSLGLSALSVYATDLQYLNKSEPTTLFEPNRQYMGILSNRFKFAGEKFILEPMVLARMTEALNWQIEPGLLIGFKDWIWVSGLYRYDYGVTIGGGFKVHDAVKIGYAYDLPLNDIHNYTQGTHEILVGIIFGTRKDAATRKELEELRQRLMQQDSLFSAAQNQQDSLQNTIDSLTNRITDMQYRMDSLEYTINTMEISVDDSTLAELLQSGALSAPSSPIGKEVEKMRKELEELKKQKEEMQKSIEQAKSKVKDIENEMTEERTRIVQEEDLEVKRGPELGDYFLVVGSFRIEENSYNFQEDLKKRGYDAGVVYDKKRKWYYVYIAQPKSIKEGLKDLYKLREENPEFHDAWIHIMSKSLR
ncbi:MAG: hypothetical protein KatS3mg031_1038 [Chitinophagales bacterium]|nr:MAG: hypothetical protein KatS3mg031_1038 [Chitinophagales bacterium]